MVLVGRGKKAKKKQRQIAGPALTLRLIVAMVCDDEGNVLATWHLLSNAPIELLTAEQLAQCEYWRWRIESDFELLKSHGQQLEHWRQETGAAIFRRLLVATMACVTVWQLLADTSPKKKRESAPTCTWRFCLGLLGFPPDPVHRATTTHGGRLASPSNSRPIWQFPGRGGREFCDRPPCRQGTQLTNEFQETTNDNSIRRLAKFVGQFPLSLDFSPTNCRSW